MTVKRPRQPMPSFVKTALTRHGLLQAYKDRPPYQKNDYLWWINSAKRDSTKEKRLKQMLFELKDGTRYMNMTWNEID